MNICPLPAVCLYLLFSLPVSLSGNISSEDSMSTGGRHCQATTSSQRIQLLPVRTYGGLSVTTEDEIMSYPLDMAVDSSGALYILDGKEQEINVYDTTGGLIRVIGSRGQGPGEFLRPVGIDIDDNGLMYISDGSQYTIIVLTLAGDFVKRLNPVIERTWYPSYKIMHNGNILKNLTHALHYYPAGQTFDTPVLRMYTPAGELIQEFGELQDYKDQTCKKSANAAFTVFDENDTVYVTYEFQNRIEKYSPEGQLVWRIKRKLPYTPPRNPKAVLHRASDGVVSGVNLPRMHTVSAGIAIDGKKRIWVLSYARQPKLVKQRLEIAEGEKNFLTFEIFNPGGLKIADVPLVGSFRPVKASFYEITCLVIDGERLFLLNNYDTSVQEYRIIG